MHECDDCGDVFETLTRLRLHDCEMNGSEKTKVLNPDPGSNSSVNNQPEEVEMGLEPGYNCPECDYSKSGISTGPHAFLDHLRDEHGYSNEEAHRVLNG